jgi:hypothetical protein
MDLYKRLGMRHSKVYYGFDGATALTSAMLNVGYMFGEKADYECSLYTLLEQSGDIFLYECNARLPFGYVAPLGYDLPEGHSNQALRLQNEMVRALGVKGMLFVKDGGEVLGDDVRVTAREAGNYYALLTASGTGKVECLGGSRDQEIFKDLKKGAVLYLGYLDEGETLTLTNGDEKDETPKISADVYRLDEEVLGQALEILSAQHMELESWESDHISGRITMEGPGRLILSVPYEDGWTILVNGEETEGVLFGGCLVAFDLEPGEYEISLSYRPAGTVAGIAVSMVSILTFAVIEFLRRGGYRIFRERLWRKSGLEVVK